MMNGRVGINFFVGVLMMMTVRGGPLLLDVAIEELLGCPAGRECYLLMFPCVL